MIPVTRMVSSLDMYVSILLTEIFKLLTWCEGVSNAQGLAEDSSLIVLTWLGICGGSI